jgi:hypothetical protein
MLLNSNESNIGQMRKLKTDPKHYQWVIENSKGQENDSPSTLLISTLWQFILTIVLADSSQVMSTRVSTSRELSRIPFVCLIRIKRIQSNSAQIDVSPDTSAYQSLSVAYAAAGRVRCFGLRSE